MYEYNLGIRFEKIVVDHFDKTALRFGVDEEDEVSYGELNSKANQIARYLIKKGIGTNDVICITGIKNVYTFACMLACLKIGAVYTIIDPDSPIERLIKIINRVSPKILFLNSLLADSLKVLSDKNGSKVILNESDSLEAELSSISAENLSLSRKVTGVNPAYIMFTSGSTGFPKGAVMTHANVMNMINWAIDKYKITDTDILTNVNPLFFDNSVFDFYTALFSGASLVPFSKDVVTNPKLLIELIDELKCTSWFSVPSMLIYLDTMKVFSSKNFKYIKRIIFGGEGYPKAKLKRLFDTYGDHADIHNVYGPTECTCICSSYQLSLADFEDLKGLPPLGRMSDNFSYLILDEKNESVKNGEFGELCLLGPNVGKGYYNDQERTDSSFIQNPYNKNYSELLYKTGDLVRFNPDDEKIYIHGRKDNQIKHMGYRIELEEVEAALSCISYVSQSAVLQSRPRGLSQLLAVVSINNDVQEQQLRKDLKIIIPDYMIPSVFYFEKHLPKNQNGKIDRAKLYKKYVGE